MAQVGSAGGAHDRFPNIHVMSVVPVVLRGFGIVGHRLAGTCFVRALRTGIFSPRMWAFLFTVSWSSGLGFSGPCGLFRI